MYSLASSRREELTAGLRDQLGRPRSHRPGQFLRVEQVRGRDLVSCASRRAEARLRAAPCGPARGCTHRLGCVFSWKRSELFDHRIRSHSPDSRVNSSRIEGIYYHPVGAVSGILSDHVRNSSFRPPRAVQPRGRKPVAAQSRQLLPLQIP